MSTILDEIFAQRGPNTVGGNPTNFIELFGAKVVPLSFIQPDPSTFREPYYYNTRLNKLFVKETGINPFNNLPISYWRVLTQ